MAEQAPGPNAPLPAAPQPSPVTAPKPVSMRWLQRAFVLRQEPTVVQIIGLGLLCIGLALALWWYVTWGEPTRRIVHPLALPSPMETFSQFHDLWFEDALTLNTLASLKRVLLGFGLAIAVGVPIGILCGCFGWADAFFLPLNIFGRNIPVAALIPLTFFFFGAGELQKVMFIFIACVAFVISDSARAVRDVGSQYIDTAWTLGASRAKIILKVLVPLAMPSIFNSLRLLFGLAFGYIMLAEVVVQADEAGGLGAIINIAQSRGGRQAYIILVLLLIPLVALGIDRVLFWIQRELFPHRYGGIGILNWGVRALFHAWEDLWSLVRRPAAAAHLAVPQSPEVPRAKP